MQYLNFTITVKKKKFKSLILSKACFPDYLRMEDIVRLQLQYPHKYVNNNRGFILWRNSLFFFFFLINEELVLLNRKTTRTYFTKRSCIF